ncbi:bifunctional diguanylate cyclase/phosphodiesterase [Curvibacter gracilis]|uniref:bifunctional diguanylate cyclase/phosphodiesterase n=1 Tax=Curvibacter gracilis TaxID=230310 RepID=UPI000488A761|nr:EAL domain-containing protein [Curvibacter gracilis]
MVALGVLALLTYIGLMSWGLKQSHDREFELAQHSQENLAKVLESHAAATVQKIDTVLLATQLRLGESLQAERNDPRAINAALAKYLGLITESQSLRVANAEGAFIYDAAGTLFSASIRDRDYFLRNQADPSGQLVISDPIFARITHNWVITLSRRIDDREGRFAGLVQAAVRADHFQDFYQGLKLGPGRTVALLDDQMRLVARFPEAPERLGQPIGSPALRSLIAERRTEAIYSAPSAVDGVERLFSLRKIGSHPLYVLVGWEHAEFMANWYRQVFWAALSAVILALVLLGWVLVWLRTYDEARRLARGMTEAYETTVHRTRALLDSLPDPAWLSDRNSRMIAVNQSYCRASGRAEEAIVGRSVAEIWPAEVAAEMSRQEAETLNSLQQRRRESVQDIADGSRRSYEHISTPVLDSSGQLVGVAGVARDITQIRRDEERIRDLAAHDALTALPNRTQLHQRLTQALALTVGEQAGIALMFLDLDHFKNINDTLGHDVGDELLKQVAQRLRANLDARDTVSRQGGDEFIVLLQQATGPAQVAQIAQRLIEVVSKPFQVGRHELQVGVSIGISTYPGDGVDIGSLLKNADTAMYQAKAAGGGAYQFFTAEMNAHIMVRVALENSLRQAIRNQEFELHYQPQVDGASGELLGLEALIRWNHPEQGPISPARFIPIAEEAYLINPIGEWVLREACRQARAWMDQGLAPRVVAVNLSAVQFRQQNLVDQVARALQESGLEARWLELEITESAFIHNTERIIELLAQLRGLGVKLSVDDFGTGYSSLGYLKRLPFDKIKIDQSFVRDLPGSADDAAITRAIIGIAGSLHKEVIAEGVETAEQREFLLRQGCLHMQGYFFARPMPARALEAWLRAGKVDVEPVSLQS